jgi:hypothetical protein
MSELENTESADQKRRRILLFITAHVEIFGQRGAVVQTWRDYAGRRLGPYFSLIFRKDGKQRSLYLGSDPQFASEVRELLEQTQKPRQERRTAERRRACVESELRRWKEAWDSELRPYGLRLKGWEVRGWRTARELLAYLRWEDGLAAELRGPVELLREIDGTESADAITCGTLSAP